MAFSVRRLIDRVREEIEEERRRTAVREQAALVRKWNRLGSSPAFLNPLGTVYEQVRSQDSSLRPARFVRQQVAQEAETSDSLRRLAEAFAPTDITGYQPYAFRGMTPLEAGGQIGREFAEAVQTPEQQAEMRRIGAELERQRITPGQLGQMPFAQQANVLLPTLAPQPIGRPAGLGVQPEPAGWQPIEEPRPWQQMGEIGLGLVDVLEAEVEAGRPVMGPVGGFLGRRIGEQFAPTIPPALRALGVPDIPGTRRAADIGEQVGKVALPEVAVATNLVPLPIVDDVLRVFAKGVPLAARLLSREGRMASRAELRQLSKQIGNFGRRSPDVAQQADQAVGDIERALLRPGEEPGVLPGPAELPPEAVMPSPVERGVAEAGVVPPQAVPAEAAPPVPARAALPEEWLPVEAVPEAPIPEQVPLRATTADVPVERPPGIAGGAQGRPLLDQGKPVDIDLWRAVERGRITGPQADDLLRGVADKLHGIPGMRQLSRVFFSPASQARIDPTTRAGVVYRMVESVQNNERQLVVERLRQVWPSAWQKGSRAGQVRIGKKDIALGDLGEAWLRGDEGRIRSLVGRSLDEREVAWLQQSQDYMRRLTSQWGVQTGKVHVAGETVWPRFVLDESGRVGIRRPIGTKQSPLKVRVFDEMEQGIQKNIDYADPIETMDLFGRAMQKMTRDDILAKVVIEDDIGRIVNPKGLLPQDLVDATEAARIGYRDASRALRTAQAAERAGRPMTRVGARPAARSPEVRQLKAAEDVARKAWLGQRAKYSRALNDAQSRALSGRLGERPGISLGPGLQRVIFPEESLRTLEKMLGPGSRVMGTIARVASVPRLTMAGLLDIGQMSLQMATVFFRRPQNWARGVARGFQSMGVPKFYSRWLSESPMAQRAATHGVDLGGTEFTEAVRKGGLLGFLRRTPLGAIPRGFDGMIGATKVYEFESLARIAVKGGDPPEELFRIGGYLNTKLGTTNTSQIGMAVGQQQAEAGFGFFSPRYTRSVPGMLAWAFGKGVPARDAREALALMLLGGAGTFYGLARGGGLSHDEAVERLNPGSGGRFLSFPIFGNEIGFGGAYRSYMRFAVDLAKEDNWDFDSWSEAAVQNPLVRFLRSRTSPVTGTLMDFLTGEDFLGREVDVDLFMGQPETLVDYAFESTLPFSLESAMEARGGLSGALATFGAEFVGGRAYPESNRAMLERRFEEKYGRPYNREIDTVIAQQDEELRDLLLPDPVSPRLREHEREREEREAFLAERETKLRLPEKAAAVLRGNIPAVAGFNEAYEEYRSTAADAVAQDYFGTEPRERETEQGQRYDEYRKISPWETRFENPETLEIDWGLYMEAKDAAFAPLPRELQQAIESRTSLQDEGAIRLVRALRDWRDELDPYYDREEGRQREAFRRGNPRIDAILWITGSGISKVVTSAARQKAVDILRTDLGIRIDISDVPRRQKTGGGWTPSTRPRGW